MSAIRGFFHPQEWLWFAFLAGMATWLCAARGLGEPLVWIFAALLVGWVIFIRAARAGGWWERARLLYAALVAVLAYLALGRAVPMVNGARLDSTLQAADTVIFGTQPALLLEPLVRPWLTELLHACYFLYYPWIVVCVLLHVAAPLPVLRRLCAGMFTVFALGSIGYALLPAAGPIFEPALAARFTVPLEGGFFTAINGWIVATGCNRVDAFPSIHCALTGFLLWFAWTRSRAAFALLLAPAAGLWLATVYLRYHYFVDVLAGIPVALAGIAMARFFPAGSVAAGGSER